MRHITENMLKTGRTFTNGAKTASRTILSTKFNKSRREDRKLTVRVTRSPLKRQRGLTITVAVPSFLKWCNADRRR